MTIYTQTARFDTAIALSEDQMFRMAPSIFARDAHDSRSERFKPIPTIEIVRGLAKEGVSVVGVQQAGGRGTTATHGKHLIRLRRLDEQHQVGDSVFEVLLKNANDGSAAYDLMAGLFRIVCMNSLVAETPHQESLRVRHTGDAIGKVIEGTYTVMERAGEIAEKAQSWRNIKLTADHRAAYAKGAHVERFGDEAKTLVKPEQLLIPRRTADNGTDLWSTYNVVQENCMKGGIAPTMDARRAYRATHGNAARRTTTRQLNGIDQTVQVNKGLWAMADWLSRHAG
jgi:hypothetical protein